jgi:hypothetical protein
MKFGQSVARRVFQKEDFQWQMRKLANQGKFIVGITLSLPFQLNIFVRF